MAPYRQRLEWLIERWLWRFRLIAIVPVVMSLLSAAAAFLCGTLEVLGALKVVLDGSGETSYEIAKQLGKLVGGVDLYLIGIALLIFGYGVYELLISNIEAAHQDGKGGGNGLLDIRNLDDLKEKLVKVIVVALINGEEPNGLSLAKLTQTFPEDWTEQRRQFGFATD